MEKQDSIEIICPSCGKNLTDTDDKDLLLIYKMFGELIAKAGAQDATLFCKCGCSFPYPVNSELA